MKPKYTRSAASEAEIEAHLAQCDAHFSPPLSDRVVIGDYAEKLFQCAVTFEAWIEDELVGLVAAYLTGTETKRCFITSVSCLEPWRGRGIASTLLRMTIDHAREQGFDSAVLEVAKGDRAATGLYEKLGFKAFKDQSASRLMKLAFEEQT